MNLSSRPLNTGQRKARGQSYGEIMYLLKAWKLEQKTNHYGFAEFAGDIIIKLKIARTARRGWSEPECQ